MNLIEVFTFFFFFKKIHDMKWEKFRILNELEWNGSKMKKLINGNRIVHLLITTAQTLALNEVSSTRWQGLYQGYVGFNFCMVGVSEETLYIFSYNLCVELRVKTPNVLN